MSTQYLTGRTSLVTLTRLATEQPGEQELEFVRVLNSRIVGQEAGKAAAARAVRRANNKLRNRRGPIYKLLQIGKSRTGKTLTAETAALSLHGDPDALIRVDCAEYQHGHEVSRLLGAPPSYVGYDDPNKGKGGKGGDGGESAPNPTALLARENIVASRKGSKTPITVILLDEVEKCSSSLKDVLLAIFDRGKIRLANNTEADFTDCIFFMTSNLGMEKVERMGNPMGFTAAPPAPPTDREIESVVKGELKRAFRPEFLKRVDEVVIFGPLTREQLDKLYDVEIGLVRERIERQLDPQEHFELKVDASVKQFILRKAFEDEGGVAEVKQILERYLVDVLGNEVGKRPIEGGDLVVVSHEPGEESLIFQVGKGAGGVPRPASVPVQRPSTSLAVLSPASRASLAQRKLRLLAKRMVKETASEKFHTEKMISIGSDLGQLAREMGKEWNDFHSLQDAFMERDAFKLLWTKVLNAHYYWLILAEAAEIAVDLPIKVADVRQAFRNIKARGPGDPRSYAGAKDDAAEVAQLVLEGMFLVKQDPETLRITLVDNPLFV